jgi:hypothetical protein
MEATPMNDALVDENDKLPADTVPEGDPVAPDELPAR